MKYLKRINGLFNTLRVNEMDDTDFGSGNGANSTFLDDQLKDFLISVKNLTKDYLKNIEFESKKDRDNRPPMAYVISIKLPQEDELRSFIHKEISNGIDNYDNLVEVGKYDKYSQHIILKFKIDDGIYLVPLILTMSSDIERSKFGKSRVEYSVWLNTYVAKKVK